MSEENVLKQFMRTEKIFVKLPSEGKFYDEDVASFTDNNEIGILPMTAIDELSLTNPDALLNGEGIKKVVESCCPLIKNAKKLFSPDIDILLLGIRHASYGDELKFQVDCPECKAENHYTVSIRSLIEKIEFLNPPYIIEFDQKLKVHVRPYTFETNSKLSMQALEISQLLKTVGDQTLEDIQKLTQYSEQFSNISKTTVDVLLDGIEKVEIITDEKEKLFVKDRDDVNEWLHNIDRLMVDRIREKIIEINQIGIDKSMPIVCETCEHEWTTHIEFNPTDFFG